MFFYRTVADRMRRPKPMIEGTRVYRATNPVNRTLTDKPWGTGHDHLADHKTPRDRPRALPAQHPGARPHLAAARQPRRAQQRCRRAHAARSAGAAIVL